ncbi:hypothetical protein FBU59_000524 [Linderina macrospora]|uniref:Uncharacterized protein n=1 Tax=Linderina macrospora TaxID=4868 RepID=A0ACC1JGL1_9FUNG|nr:hypothetical protein FBU59_000524 [Linderina macrospora]
MAQSTNPIRVVVVGGSYAGSGALKTLYAASKSQIPSMHITLIDQGTHYFHMIGFPKAIVDLAYAAKSFLPFANLPCHQFICARMTSVLDAHHLQLDNGDTVEFDYLVLATGSRTPAPSKVQGKSKEDGLAEITRLSVAIEAAKSVLVIGGGAVGVEIAGQIAAKYSGSDKQVTIVHGGDRLLPAYYKSGLSSATVSKLKQLGVRVVLNERVDVPEDFGFESHIGHAVLKGASGDEYSSDVQILATGLRTESDFLGPLEQDSEEPLRTDHGTIRVLPTMQMRGPYTNIFVPGDNNDYPVSCKYGFKAEMQGDVAAANIKKLIQGKPLGNWSDWVDAIFVPIGPKMGVAQVVGLVVPSLIADWTVRLAKSGDYFLWLVKTHYKGL